METNNKQNLNLKIDDKKKKLNDLGYSDNDLKKIVELMLVEKEINIIISDLDKIRKLFINKKIGFDNLKNILEEIKINLENNLPKRKNKDKKIDPVENKN
ncbi:hypothetical protein [Fusobacterium polymorphum]|uniref:hypothetical protein n=1 Tax=Fusobacterium nucleatum subsp. polymorphum TaxID=76857 RepID=UPI00300A1F1A